MSNITIALINESISKGPPSIIFVQSRLVLLHTQINPIYLYQHYEREPMIGYVIQWIAVIFHIVFVLIWLTQGYIYSMRRNCVQKYYGIIAQFYAVKIWSLLKW